MLRRLIALAVLAAGTGLIAPPASADYCVYVVERLDEEYGIAFYIDILVPIPMYPKGVCIPMFVDTPPIELPPIMVPPVG